MWSNPSGGSLVGCSLRGKWSGHTYRLQKLLGSGQTGHVYLAQSNRTSWALKVSDESSEIALEYRMLKRLNDQVQGQRLGPVVVDIDDAVGPDGKPLYFYVMEYVDGVPVTDYHKRHGTDQMVSWVTDLLQTLHLLHEQGYCFGDLKPENLLIDERSGTARLIDFGGVTLIGSAVRQFTPLYDRARWKKGSRKADRQYDIFAVCALLLFLLVPEFATGSLHITDWKHLLGGWARILDDGIHGRYSHALEMVHAIREQSPQALHPVGSKSAPSRKRRSLDRSDWMAITSVLLAVSAITLVIFL